MNTVYNPITFDGSGGLSTVMSVPPIITGTGISQDIEVNGGGTLFPSGTNDPEPASPTRDWVDHWINHYTGDGSAADTLTKVVQGTSSPDDALSRLKELAQISPEYMELYLQLLAERENTEWAWNEYKNWNENYYQRTFEDIKKAGYNPWLALTNGLGAGQGSISSPGSWSGSAEQVKAQKQATQAQRGNTMISAFTALLGALVIAAMKFA